MSMRYPAGFISAFYNPLKNPNAPTIGTATASSGSASIAFTAPSDVGGSAITSYIAISTPGGFTGTAASSPVTVTGLTNGTAYTFKVWANNSYGPSVLSAASNSVTPAMSPGTAYEGGYFAGQISTTGTGVADYNLVVGPISSAQSTLQWKTSNTYDAGVDSVIDGPGNSNVLNDSAHPAVQFCKGLSVGGYSDWYMPAQNELEICYYNLKPTTTSNNTSTGANTNAVPSRSSNYTSGTPTQTSASLFITSTGAQAFTASYYWSSTSPYNAYARRQHFGYGLQDRGAKVNTTLVRAIRRVAV